MGYLHIKCSHCGGHWEVYNRNMNEDAAKACPHCREEIDYQTWERFILPAFGEMDDANRELVKDHCNRAPLFSVEYRKENTYEQI